MLPILLVLATAEPIRVACVGDSITEGAGLRDAAKESYPAVLGATLGDEYAVKNFGVSGRTLLNKGDAPYTGTSQYKAALAFEPNIVVICLGTNDTKPQNWKHADDFIPNYTAFAKAFTGLKSSPKVFLCLPVPAFPGDFGIDDVRIKLGVLPKVRAVAKELQLPVIDLYEELGGKKSLFPDQVHPNAQGAARIAQAVAKAIAKKE